MAVVTINAVLYILTTLASEILVWTGTITSCKKSFDNILYTVAGIIIWYIFRIYTNRCHQKNECIGYLLMTIFAVYEGLVNWNNDVLVYQCHFV